LDNKLHQHLESTLGIDYKNTFHLMQGDAIDAPLGLLPATVSSFKIVANLPYAISTPWFAKILQSPNLPQTIVVMLQKEAAERLTAQPGTKKISPISLCLQAAFDVEGTYKVARNAFYPTPDVDSVLLSLNRKTIPYRFHPTIIALMQKFFTQRRKQLAHLIKQDTLHATLFKKWTDHLSTLHIPLTHRPEMLTLTEWIALNNLFQTPTHSPTP
jgi:16S rRNA (adenine1518-N6/adenine1519-N6)-dimethyltransferase